MLLFKKYFLTAAAALLAAVSVCSCSTGSGGNTSVKNLTEFIPITATHEGGRNYYLIVKDVEEQYWKQLIKGAAVSGNELEVNVYMSGSDSETNIEQQIALVNKAVEKGADAVIITPDDAVKLSACVTKLHSEGIPVVLADTIVNCHDYDVCFMTDNMIAGREAAKELLSEMHRNGLTDDDDAYIAVLSGAITVPTLNERVAGFCGYWSENAPKNWKILDEIKKSSDYDSAVKDTKSMLEKYSGIKGIFAVNYFTASSSANIIQAQNRTDISLVSFDFPDEIRKLMRNEKFTVSTILQKNYDMGYNAVRACDSICNGEKPTQKYVDTGIALVNPETRNTPQVQEILAQF